MLLCNGTAVFAPGRDGERNVDRGVQSLAPVDPQARDDTQSLMQTEPTEISSTQRAKIKAFFIAANFKDIEP